MRWGRQCFQISRRISSGKLGKWWKVVGGDDMVGLVIARTGLASQFEYFFGS